MPSSVQALVPHLIGAGATLGTGALASKVMKSKPSLLEQQQLDLASQASKQGSTMSKNLFDLGMPATQQPLNYWSSILSGDRSKMTSALGPELSRIGEGYQTAAQTSAALMPRGGPTPDFLAQQPYNQQRDVSTLFQQFRPQAADKLSGAGGNLLSNSINALYSSTSAGRNILDYETQRRQRDREAGAGIGKSIYDIFYPAQGQEGLASTLGDIFKSKGVSGSGAGSSTVAAGSSGAGVPSAISGGALAPLAPLIGSIAPAGAGAAVAGGALPLGAATQAGLAAGLGTSAPAIGSVAPAGAAAGGGSSSAIAGLLTNPFTAVVAGAIIGTTAWLKSQAHHEASTWVRGFQNPFDQQMDQINRQFHEAAQSGRLTAEQATALRVQVQQLVSEYQRKLQEFSQKGSDERTVARQAQQTVDQRYGPNFSNFLSGMDQIIQGLA